MRSGGLDSLVRFVRPGAPVRAGRSRVPGPDVLVADNVPCSIVGGVGAERAANDLNVPSLPIVVTVRREPDLDDLGAGDAVILIVFEGVELAAPRRLDIKSVRPSEGDPRRALEIAAVGDAPS